MIIFGGNNFNEFVYQDAMLESPLWYKLNFYNIMDVGLNISNASPNRETVWAYHLGMISREIFGQEYARFIFENDIPFISFMEILMGEYYSVDVFVHYDDSNPVICEYIEILIGIIRERYHKLCSIVNEVSDLNWLEDSMMDDYGNHMFDMDRMRYLRLKGMMPV